MNSYPFSPVAKTQFHSFTSQTLWLSKDSFHLGKIDHFLSYVTGSTFCKILSTMGAQEKTVNNIYSKQTLDSWSLGMVHPDYPIQGKLTESQNLGLGEENYAGCKSSHKFITVRNDLFC